VSRSHLDMEHHAGLDRAVVLALLAVEYLLLEPIKREVERWREVDA
jgi:NitT/TauT family transport system permease protein